MLTPLQIATKPHISPVFVPEYDFHQQTRWSGISLMGTTSSTQQTFDSRGQPKDQTSDKD
jgi:hypothetical protein